MQKSITILLLFIVNLALAQKKPLDHQVYDSWESIASKQISNNGMWAAYNVAQQEGDSKQYLNSMIGNQKIVLPRATMLKFSADSKFATFLIKPLFKDTRLAKIKKKKTDESPKDSLGYVNLSSAAIVKVPRVKSYQIPENGLALIAYHLEKPDTAKKTGNIDTSATVPSTKKTDYADLAAEDDKPGTDKKTD